MKKLLILGFVLALAACASVPNPFKPAQLATAEAGYVVAQDLAIAYITRPLCTKTKPFSVSNVCAYRSVITRIQAADFYATVSIREANAFLRNHPTLDATDVINIALEAVDAFKRLAANPSL